MIRPDSDTKHYAAKAAADDPLYQRKVAIPMMAAIDSMPKVYRQLVHEYGYVDIYRAWRRGMTVKQILARIDEMGMFKL